MLGKIKSVLGIEGVKVEIRTHEPVNLKSRLLSGELVFTSLSKQFIKSAHFSFKEKYKKGRGKLKTKEVLELGTLDLDISKSIEKEGVLMVPFEMNFLFVASDIEKFGHKNVLNQQLVRFAKLLKNARSEYFLTVDVKIEGNPFGTSSRKIVNIN